MGSWGSGPRCLWTQGVVDVGLELGIQQRLCPTPLLPQLVPSSHPAYSGGPPAPLLSPAEYPLLPGLTRSPGFSRRNFCAGKKASLARSSESSGLAMLWGEETESWREAPGQAPGAPQGRVGITHRRESAGAGGQLHSFQDAAGKSWFKSWGGGPQIGCPSNSIGYIATR